MQLSAASGEEGSSDAGAIKVHFFKLILDESRKRSFEGSYSKLLPRRSNSHNFLIFGITLGHSLRHGGAEIYGLQPWVFKLIRGLGQTDEKVMTLITKHDIPKHTGVIDLIRLINKLNNSQSQRELLIRLCK